jgi:hypothetical protein
VSTGCPTPEELTGFGLGLLPEPRLEAIADHLADCLRCLAQLRQAGPSSDPVVTLLRLLGTEADGPPEPACERLVARARAIPVGVSPSSSPTGPDEDRPAVVLRPPARLGQYELVEQVAAGGMGVIYRAVHTQLKRTVALKLLPEARLGDPRAVARFKREMEAAGALDLHHPNIIRTTDAGSAGGYHFIVMEFADGIDLARVVQYIGPLAVADACAAIVQAADGLQYLHERGLVHRDLKPSNLMLTPEGHVKVLDLGLARLYGERFPVHEATSTGYFMGTADYVAPEQAADARAVDIRADIYSLGCTLFKLLTGKAPYSGPGYDTPLRKVIGHTHDPVPRARDHRPDLPAQLDAILARMMAKSPADRYAEPTEAAAALRPLAAGADLRRLLASARAANQNEGVPSVPRTTTGGLVTPVVEVHPLARRRWAVSTALIILLAGMGLLLALLPPGRPAWEGVLAQQELRPPIWQPGDGGAPRRADNTPGNSEMYSAPRVLEWPKPAGSTSWQSIGGKLSVSSDGQLLIALGRAETPDHVLRISLIPIVAADVGGSGLFFGYQDGEADRRPCKRFHLIKLRRRNDGWPWVLSRVEHTVLVPSGAESLHVVNDVPAPKWESGEFRLMVVIKAGRVARVCCNETELPSLADQPVPAPPRKTADYCGQFGVYVHHNTSHFHSPAALFHERPDECLTPTRTRPWYASK